MAKMTDRYVQSARDYHDSGHQEHAMALHQHYIHALDELSEGAKQHIIDHGMADVAAHLHASTSERMAIAALATSNRQIPALQKIRKRIVSGESGESHDNEATDEHLTATRERRGRLRR